MQTSKPKPLRLQFKLASEMQYDELQDLLYVYLAIVQLGSKGQPQSPVLIAKVLDGRMSIPTISKYRQWLYWFGVIIPDIDHLDPTTWKGTTKVFFAVNSWILPSEVWDLIPSKYVWRKQVDAVHVTGIGTRINGDDDDHVVFHPAAYLKVLGNHANELLKGLTRFARKKDPRAVIDEAWLIRHGEGKIIEFKQQDKERPIEAIARLNTLFRSFDDEKS